MAKQPTTPIPRPKITPKEAKFVKGIAQGKTKVQAAMDAYPGQSYVTAASTATENLNKPKLQQALQEAYDLAGITPQSIADVFSDAMLAKKTYQDGGKLVESHLPDHHIRVSAARTAAQLVLERDNSGTGATFNFNLNPSNYVKPADPNS